MGIEENDNGQGNGSMVNLGLKYMEIVNKYVQICGQMKYTII